MQNRLILSRIWSGGLGPSEGLGIAIVSSEVVADGLLELNGAAMSTPANLSLGERGEPTLDLIEPRGGGRGEMRVEARMSSHPRLDRRGFVSAVVVHDQMHILPRRRGLIDRAQEGEELLGSMP